MPRTNTPPLGLTRDQLALFLKDHEQIKAFENLFAIVEEIAPDVAQQAIIAAGSAQAAAAEAIGLLTSIAQDTATNAAAAEAKAQLALDALAAVRQQVDYMASAPPPREFKRARWGSFYDTTTQTAAVANTAYAMTFNTTDLSNGVRLRSPSTSEVEVDSEGVYNIQFSAQLDNTSGGNHQAYIWLRVNGVDVANSASEVRLKGNDGELVAAWNWFYQFKARDYFQIMWSAVDTAVQLKAVAAAAPVPAIPSVILTVGNNIQGVQ